MIIYRIAQSKYKDDLSGNGAMLYGGRWNSQGLPVLYCAQHISLAVLELVVNFSRSASPLQLSYHLMEIEIPDTVHIITEKNLKRDWTLNQDYTRYIGDQFLGENNELVLQVPSAVIPEEHNFLINPQHAHFSKVKIISARKYGFDNRLLN